MGLYLEPSGDHNRSKKDVRPTDQAHAKFSIRNTEFGSRMWSGRRVRDTGRSHLPRTCCVRGHASEDWPGPQPPACGIDQGETILQKLPKGHSRRHVGNRGEAMVAYCPRRKLGRGAREGSPKDKWAGWLISEQSQSFSLPSVRSQTGEGET